MCRVKGRPERQVTEAPSPSVSGDMDTEADAPSEAAGPASGTILRLGSVGQDCQLCLWDLVMPAPQRHRLAHASRSAPLLSCMATRQFF